MKNVIILLGVICYCAATLSGQSLICPASTDISCNTAIDFPPTIENGSGYVLEEERLFDQIGCAEYDIEITYKLVNENNADDVADQCSFTLSIQPFDADIRFPVDTIVTGLTVNEVQGKSILTDGLFPMAQNSCSIIYSFEDEIVPLRPDVVIFRNWTALNWCSGELTAALQRITLSDIPEGSTLSNVSDCNGTEIYVKDLVFSLNGEPIELQSCTPFFDSLHHTMNCLADSLLVSDTDVLSISSEELSDPLLGLKLADLINIQRHILGLKRFETDCAMYAADINRDGRISGADLVELRKMFIGIYSVWPFGNGTRYFVNDVERNSLEFRQSDFPLERLDIVVSNKGNTTRN